MSTAPFRPADTENNIHFDAYGDSLGRYNIFHYYKENDEYIYRKVGYWARDLNSEHKPDPWESQVVPTSQCSDPCRKTK